MHDGRTNYYSFKSNNKNYVLRPMTPSQVIADNAKTIARAQQEKASSEKSGEREIHQNVSESQKPNESTHTKRVPQSMSLIATEREMRELRENPSTLHYVLICKGEVSLTNAFTNLPPSLMSLLQEFEDVFPQEVPPGLPPLRGIEHRIDLRQ